MSFPTETHLATPYLLLTCVAILTKESKTHRRMEVWWISVNETLRNVLNIRKIAPSLKRQWNTSSNYKYGGWWMPRRRIVFFINDVRAWILGCCLCSFHRNRVAGGVGSTSSRSWGNLYLEYLKAEFITAREPCLCCVYAVSRSIAFVHKSCVGLKFVDSVIKL